MLLENSKIVADNVVSHLENALVHVLVLVAIYTRLGKTAFLLICCECKVLYCIRAKATYCRQTRFRRPLTIKVLHETPVDGTFRNLGKKHFNQKVHVIGKLFYFFKF